MSRFAKPLLKPKDRRPPPSPHCEAKIRKRECDSQPKGPLRLANLKASAVHDTGCGTSPCATGPVPGDSLCVTGQHIQPGHVGPQTHGTPDPAPVMVLVPPQRAHPSSARTTPARARKSELDQRAAQLSSSHHQMEPVLSGRLLRIRAARTFWKKDIRELISYLRKIEDDGIVNDLLPCLTECVHNRTMSLEVCADLSSLLEPLLTSKRDCYVFRSLQFVKTLVEEKKVELESLVSNPSHGKFSFCRSLIPFLIMVQGSSRMNELAQRTDHMATTARTLQDLIRNLL